MRKRKISSEDHDKIYAALKLIENLYKQGLIKQHIFKNILNDYRDCIDISPKIVPLGARVIVFPHFQNEKNKTQVGYQLE